MSLALERAWQSLSTTWRGEEQRTQTLVDVLRQRVQRQTRRLRIIVAVEVLLTVVVLTITAAALPATSAAGGGRIRIASIVLLYTGGVWAFALWNRRGIWQPYAASMADCVELLRVRAQRRMKSARFSIVVIAIATVVVSRQIATSWRAGTISALDRGIWILFGAYSIALVIGSVWYLRRARRELRELDGIGRDLEPGGG